MIFRLNSLPVFPDPSLAEEDGLLAVGGDLSAERLIAAYHMGIFPWFSEGEPILWYSPHERFVIFRDGIHISRSMHRLINSHKYEMTRDKDFASVIKHCAKVKRPGQRGTWITKDMIKAYIALHEKGLAHSIEVWQDNKLIGGMYGVAMGDVFCGESMFSLAPSASKMALIYLFQTSTYKIIDCQFHTPHLESMGGRFIDRQTYNYFLKS